MAGRAADRHLAGVSGSLTGASFVAGVAAAVSLADAPYPRPGATAEDVRRYFVGNADAARVSVAGQLVSAAALARFTVAAARFVRGADRTSAAPAAVVGAGGALAAAALVASASTSAALTTDRGASDADAVRLHRRAFLAGGPVHGVGFGLLAGGLGRTGLRTGALPRGLAVAALGSAAANLLSPLALVAPPAAWCIPAGRFSGYVVVGLAGRRRARIVAP